MGTTQLKKLALSSDMMDANQISVYVENKDYSAFEVFPTSNKIDAGTVDSFEGLSSVMGWSLEDKEEIESNTFFTNLSYPIDVPANNVEKLTIYSHATYDDSDVIFDWGDGTIERLQANVSKADYKYTSDPADPDTSNYYYCNPSHTYAKPNRRYIVKIYGSKYITLRSGTYSAGSSLISRVFDSDLPIASCVTNTSSIAAYADRLLQVRPPYMFDFKNIMNACRMFNYATSLVKAEWTQNHSFRQKQRLCNALFDGCSNLTTVGTHNDLAKSRGLNIPSINSSKVYSPSHSEIFNGCSSLTGDICDLIPCAGFIGENLMFSRMFQNCSQLSCSSYDVLAKNFWNNDRITTIAKLNVFTGCTSLDLSKIPASWGGTGNDTELIHQTYHQMIENIQDTYNLSSFDGMRDALSALLLNLGVKSENIIK